MIRQDIIVEQYHWRVVVFYAVTHYDCDTISDELNMLGADERFAKRAYENMASNSLNTGFTYSDMLHGVSLMVINRTSSEEEFANSLAHETCHLVMHIAQRRGIDPWSEEVCYLIGDLAQKMHPITKSLLSSCGCHDAAIKRGVRRYQKLKDANR